MASAQVKLEQLGNAEKEANQGSVEQEESWKEVKQLETRASDQVNKGQLSQVEMEKDM